MTICREWTLVKTQGPTAQAEPLRCRSWSCEMCAPDRRKRLIAQAIGGQPNTFITLTANPEYGTSPDHRARMLASAWRCVRQWFQHRAGNGALPFIAVFEKTKKGEPHLHILCRSYWIPQKELASFMNMLTGSPVCWIERLDDTKKCAVYCCKYCGKNPDHFVGTKRYWCSQDYEIDPPAPVEDDEDLETTFEVVKTSLYDWRTERERQGWMVWETDEGLVAQDLNQLRAATGPPSFHRPPIPAG